MNRALIAAILMASTALSACASMAPGRPASTSASANGWNRRIEFPGCVEEASWACGRIARPTQV